MISFGVMFYFCRGRSEEVVAMFQHNIFLPLPAFTQRVQYVAIGGLTLRHVTPGDSGNYSVDVTTQDSSGTFFTQLHSVILSVTGIQDRFLVMIYTLQGIKEIANIFGKKMVSILLTNIMSKNTRLNNNKRDWHHK